MLAQPKRPQGQRQATPRSATRTAPTGALLRVGALLARTSLVLALVAGGLGLFYYGGGLINAVMQHPVDQVRVEGPFKYVSHETATELISSAIDNDFVDLNINQLKHKIEQHSWIERAVITRSLPSALVVTLVEQTPIARWGDTGFLNRRGEVINTRNTQRLQALPELGGRDQQSARIMRQYQNLSRLLRSRNLTVAKLWVDELDTWQITLDQGTQLVLGKDALAEKIRRFLQVYDQHLVHQFDAVVRIDLRYTNGLAVAWSDEYKVLVQTPS